MTDHEGIVLAAFAEYRDALAAHDAMQIASANAEQRVREAEAKLRFLARRELAPDLAQPIAKAVRK